MSGAGPFPPWFILIPPVVIGGVAYVLDGGETMKPFLWWGMTCYALGFMSGRRDASIDAARREQEAP